MQPSFLRGMRQDIHKKEYKKRNRINSFFKRAGDGNRTHVSSLEGWCSTIELHPHIYKAFHASVFITCSASREMPELKWEQLCITNELYISMWIFTCQPIT